MFKYRNVQFMFWVVLLVFWLGGCEEKYVVRCDDASLKGHKLTRLRVSAADMRLRKMTGQILQKEGIRVEDDAAYTLEVETSRYAHHCNNPLTCSYDATYDGYVRVRLLQKMRLLCMVQRDYHGEFSKRLLADVIDRMFDKLGLDR